MKTVRHTSAICAAIASMAVLVVTGIWWHADEQRQPLYAVTVSTLLPQPYIEVHKQPEIEQIRAVLANPVRSPRIGHVPQPWGLQVVGEVLPLKPSAPKFSEFTCYLAPQGSLIEVGSLGDGLVAAEYRTDATGDGFCRGGEVVVARERWFTTT